MMSGQRSPLSAATVYLLLIFTTGALASESFYSSSRKRGGRGSLRRLRVFNSDESTKPVEYTYPDLTLRCCRTSSSGNDHTQSWLQANVGHYVFVDLMTCCMTHFHDDVDACLDASKDLARLGQLSSAGSTKNDESGGVTALRQRKLDKSGKSNNIYTSYYEFAQAYYDSVGKSGKSSKSMKMPVPPPSPPTPTESITPGKKALEVIMGGSIQVLNSYIPTLNFSFQSLAEVYEQTILRGLGEGYEVDVYSIGGVSVDSDGSYSTEDALGLFTRRNLNHESPSKSGKSTGYYYEMDSTPTSAVLFNLRTVKPCPECSKLDASVLGAQVFTDTFNVLDVETRSGDLTTVFCLLAELAQVIADPCIEKLLSVTGESLTMGKYKETASPVTAEEAIPTYSPTTGTTEAPTVLKSLSMSISSTESPSTMSISSTKSPSQSMSMILTEPPSPMSISLTQSPSTITTVTLTPVVSTVSPVAATMSPTLTTTTTATTLAPVISTVSPVAATMSPTLTTTATATTLAPVISTVSPVAATMSPTLTTTATATTLAPVISTVSPVAATMSPTLTTTTTTTALAPVIGRDPGSSMSMNLTPSTTSPVLGTSSPVILGGTVAPTIVAVTAAPTIGGMSMSLPDLGGTVAPTIVAGTAAPTIGGMSMSLPDLGGTVAPTIVAGTAAPTIGGMSMSLPDLGGTAAPTIGGMSMSLPDLGGTVAPSLANLDTAPPSLVLSMSMDLGTMSPANIGSTAPPSLSDVATSTITPTITPPGALYYNGFEKATTFPDTPEWITQGDGIWELSTERANSGVQSIASNSLLTSPDSPDYLTFKSANASLTTDPAWTGGTLVFSILSGLQMPFDEVAYYLDDQLAGQASDMTEFETREIVIPPGGHTVTFANRFNPNNLVVLPPPNPDSIGMAFIDDVYFLPDGVTASPIAAIITGPPGTAPPVVAGSTSSPVVAGSTTSSPVVPILEPELFDGFESGDLTRNDWAVTGEPSWIVDQAKPYEGTFSAHVRTEDVSNGGYSELDLTISLDAAAFIEFYFLAPVAMPFESLDLLVDGELFTSLVSGFGADGTEPEWAQGGALLSPGEHVVSWKLSRNPGGVPENIITTLPAPPYRIGEAYIDNVSINPATSSFVEDWDTGDFTANQWELSGDANWSVVDFGGERGLAATVDSESITANTGISELSIDIITEKGGELSFQILPQVAGPFEIANVLVDDVVVLTFSETAVDWTTQAVSILPGKRRITWQLAKNPGGFPVENLPPPPSPPADGKLWIDAITFTATV